MQVHERLKDTICVFSLFQFLAEDEEDTIAAQEKVEGNVDHAEELDDLAKEGKCFLSHSCIKWKVLMLCILLFLLCVLLL